MSKISLRLRITLMTGLIVFVVSMTSMVLSTYYATESINDAVMYTNSYYVDNILGDDYIVDTFLANDSVSEEAVAEDSETARESEAKEYAVEQSVPMFEIQENYVSELTNDFQMMELLISLGASIIGMLLTYYFSSKMLEPLHELSTKMLSVSHNNLNQQVEGADRDDEIGNLAFAFNKMTKRLDNQFARQKEFSSNVAHELRTPLSIMKMSYQVIDEDTTLSEFHETKSLNEKQVNNLIKICDDLLVFANDEEIKDKEVVNLDSIISAVLEGQNLLIEEKEINIVKDIDDTIVVIANKRLVYQLMVNLVNNAVKYNLKGGTVYIIVKKENENITITVADNGIGIDEKSLEHVFEPFYRENKSRSRKTGGSGLGLSIVKQIVDQHDWKIEVESIKNQKTIFTITI